MRIKPAIAALLALLAALAGGIALVVQPFVRPVPSQPPSVNAERLKAHVRRLSVDFHPRSHDQPRNLELAAQFIADEFKLAGAKVSFQDVVVQETTYQNVIARFGPETGPLLVIGAHYDSHGDAHAGAKHSRGFSSETHTPGADDNASGAAGLIELARLLGRAPQSRAIDSSRTPPRSRRISVPDTWAALGMRAHCALRTGRLISCCRWR